MQGGYVYILQSTLYGIYYIGSAINADERLIEHNSGTCAATKNKGPWIIKCKQYYADLKDARRIEYRLKKLKRRDYIEKIIKDGNIKMK